MKKKHIESQIVRFVLDLEKYNRKLPNPRAKNNYPFLRDFFIRFVEEQNRRAEEISSPEYQKIKEVANRLFPVKTLWNFCIDGRVIAILMHGAPAGVGSSVRVPGGILREFVRGKDGQLRLLEDSDFAMLVRKALENSKTGILAEIFDSHIGCSARQAEEQVKGKTRSDLGLRSDVSHKIQMARATSDFVEKTFGGEKKLLIILTSFDPHTGFLYMGLETSQAFAYATRHRGYSKDVLNDLIASERIIATEKLVSEPIIQETFAKHAFKLNWKEDYVKSARSFWGAIGAMRKTLIPLMQKKLIHIYPRLREADKLAKIELQERAMLLFTNAFSGYLHNLEQKTQKNKKEKHQEHALLYPYGVHREEGIKVGEGGYPPYQTSLFSVFSFEEKNLPHHVQLACSFVRTNRKERRVVDAFGYFSDPELFAEASLPILIVEIVRDQLSKEEWSEVLRIDWSDLPQNWDTMTDDAFLTYLHTKPAMPFGVAMGINNLRRKVAVLYEWYQPTSSRLIEQYAVALPLIMGRNRRVHFVVPFVKLGFA